MLVVQRVPGEFCTIPVMINTPTPYDLIRRRQKRTRKTREMYREQRVSICRCGQMRRRPKRIKTNERLKR